jgi:hypothetical protein
MNTRRWIVFGSFLIYAIVGLTFDVLGLTWTAEASGIYGYGGLGMVAVDILILRHERFEDLEYDYD